MKQPKYSPNEEQQLMSQLWSPLIADDPLAFVMYVYPWGEEGKPLANFKGPRKWQVKVLRKIAKHIAENKTIDLPKLLKMARASGRGIGKSALVAWLIDWFNTTRIGSTAIVSANTEDQLRKITFAEVAKWTAMSIHEHWWEVSGITRSPAKWLRELVETQLQKGTGYWGAVGKLWSEENTSAYAGVHNHDGVMVIFDEASGIPDGIWSVAQGFFTEITPNRFWFAFSQGRLNTGYFYKIFHQLRDQWDTDQIDARTVEGTDPQIYEEIIEEYGEDSDEAAVEVRGDFPSTDDISFISPVAVDKAMKRGLKSDLTAPIYIGVDPAAYGDKFTIYVRQGLVTLHIGRHKLTDDEKGTMEGVGHVIDAIETYDPDITTVDETGLGIVIKHRLNEQGYKVKGVNFAWAAKDAKRYGNRRAEMWAAVKKYVEVATLPLDKHLHADLVGPKKKPNSKNQLFLESKKEMKARKLASPDSGDALACTFAYSVARRKGYTARSASNRMTGAGRDREVMQAGAPSTAWLGY